MVRLDVTFASRPQPQWPVKLTHDITQVMQEGHHTDGLIRYFMDHITQPLCFRFNFWTYVYVILLAIFTVKTSSDSLIYLTNLLILRLMEYVCMTLLVWLQQNGVL